MSMSVYAGRCDDCGAMFDVTKVHGCIEGIERATLESRQAEAARAAALSAARAAGAAEMRERCAKLCDEISNSADEKMAMRNAGRINDGREDYYSVRAETAEACAAAIRSIPTETKTT